MTTQPSLYAEMPSSTTKPAQPQVSPARKQARQGIDLALKEGARTRKEVNYFNPFAATKGHEYECWRSEVSTWIGGKGCLKSPEMLEQSAVSILHHAGVRLRFGVSPVEMLREWIAR